MANIDTYRERINTLKTGIETIKNNETFNLRNPDGTVLIVRDSRDLFLPLGTVIVGNDEHVYLRVPHGNTYWTSSDRDNLPSVHDHWYHCRRSAPLRKHFLTSTQIRPYGLVLLSAVLPVGAFFLIDQAITTATR